MSNDPQEWSTRKMRVETSALLEQESDEGLEEHIAAIVAAVHNHEQVREILEVSRAYTDLGRKMVNATRGLPNLVVPIVSSAGDGNGQGPAGSVEVMRGNELVRVALPPAAAGLPVCATALRPGGRGLLSADGAMLIQASDELYDWLDEGLVQEVEYVGGRPLCRVDFGLTAGGSRWVRLGGELLAPDGSAAVAVGDRVLGSAHAALLTRRLQAAAAADPLVAGQVVELGFAGHRDYWHKLEEEIIFPLQAPEEYVGRHTSTNMPFPRVVLLSGPTGVGKSWGLRVAAQKAGAVLRETEPLSFRKGIMSHSAEALRLELEQLPALARAGEGRGVIMVLDEADSVLVNRAILTRSSVYGEEASVVSTFLNGVDRLSHNHGHLPIAIVLTSNFPAAMDQAVLRRATEVKVGYLAADEIGEVLALHLRETDAADPDDLAERLAEFLAADDVHLISMKVDSSPVTIKAREMMSPSLLASVVSSAERKARARRRQEGAEALPLGWRDLAGVIDEALTAFGDRVVRGGSAGLPTVLPDYADAHVAEMQLAYVPHGHLLSVAEV